MNRREPTGHRKPPQILSTEVGEQAGNAWPSPAHAPGEQVSGGGRLDTIPKTHD
ncbi:hypothetical protein [Streptomyces sp. cg2]|uniref:hypothetical protein n=1 Tax=Streptomyces sp. cg2 TaxID=3238799 RepID=UPI0034E25ACD